jgi:hypothetical protein
MAAAWVPLNMTVPKEMTDMDYVNPEVPVAIGSPPQPVSITVDLAGDLLAAFSTDCAFCPGYTLFDADQSSTYHVSTWARALGETPYICNPHWLTYCPRMKTQPGLMQIARLVDRMLATCGTLEASSTHPGMTLVRH